MLHSARPVTAIYPPITSPNHDTFRACFKKHTVFQPRRYFRKVSLPKPLVWVQASKCGQWGPTEMVSVKTDQGLPMPDRGGSNGPAMGHR